MDILVLKQANSEWFFSTARKKLENSRRFDASSVQPGALEGLAAAAQGVFRRSGDRRRQHDGRDTLDTNMAECKGGMDINDKSIALCRRAGFRKIKLRGDTDFTQTAYLDDWDEAGDVQFVFSLDATAEFVRNRGKPAAAGLETAASPGQVRSANNVSRPTGERQRASCQGA